MKSDKTKKIQLRVSDENLEVMATIRDACGLSSLSEVLELLLKRQ